MKDKKTLAYQQRIGVTINALAEEIRCIVGTVVKTPLINFRIKDPETLQKKMQIEDTQSVFSINDVYGIRIIVESVEEGYQVLEKIEAVFDGYLDHDYFKKVKPVPSINGKVLRLLQFVAYRNDVAFEIQITTTECHAVNESLHEGYHHRKYQS